jgi:hypothetical protein
MLKKFITKNNDFLLGTAFGIILSPIFSIMWHFLWNYGPIRSWTTGMSEVTLTLIKGAFLSVIAVIILVVYLKNKNKEDKPKDTKINENKITSSDLLKAINTQTEAINKQTEAILRVIQNQNRGEQSGQSKQPEPPKQS